MFLQRAQECWLLMQCIAHTTYSDDTEGVTEWGDAISTHLCPCRAFSRSHHNSSAECKLHFQFIGSSLPKPAFCFKPHCLEELNKHLESSKCLCSVSSFIKAILSALDVLVGWVYYCQHHCRHDIKALWKSSDPYNVRINALKQTTQRHDEANWSTWNINLPAEWDPEQQVHPFVPCHRKHICLYFKANGKGLLLEVFEVAHIHLLLHKDNGQILDRTAFS